VNEFHGRLFLDGSPGADEQNKKKVNPNHTLCLRVNCIPQTVTDRYRYSQLNYNTQSTSLKDVSQVKKNNACTDNQHHNHLITKNNAKQISEKNKMQK
jgi:hypothetical protein